MQGHRSAKAIQKLSADTHALSSHRSRVRYPFVAHFRYQLIHESLIIATFSDVGMRVGLNASICGNCQIVINQLTVTENCLLTVANSYCNVSSRIMKPPV